MRLLIICSLTALLTLTPAAQAKSPPKGDYGCTYSTYSGTYYAGTLNILSKTRYSVNKKKKGDYTTNGKRIRFKTGDYKGLWRGKWERVESVLRPGEWGHVIYLRSIKDPDGTYSLNCTRNRS